LRTAALTLTAVVLVLASLPQAQGTAPTTPLTLLTRDARRTVSTILLNGQEFIGLDEVAGIFQLMVREDAVARGVTITYKGRTVIASLEQPMASVNGRVVTLPAPVTRAGGRLLIPIDFLSRALAPIYDQPIDVRRASRLLIVGALRVPHVVARIDAAGPPTRVTVEVTPALPVSPAVDAGRVLLRVDADALDMVPPPPPAGLVDQIAGANQTTIAVALNARAGMPRISTTVSADATRMTIDVPLAAQETQAPPAPVPNQPPLAAVPTPPALPLPGETAVLQTMVIDPGHGGDDTGVRGAKGMLEKQIALDVAMKLKTLVETRMGVRVVMTRSDDRSVTPDERDAIANNSKADLFLSLHVNGAPAPAVAGAQVYFLRLDRAGQAARQSAAASELVLPTINGGTRPIDVIPWDLAQAEHVEASSRFAIILEEELQKHAPMAAKPLQQEPMRVLSGVNMPAALVEMAYLTNAGQEQDVQSADFQNGVAQGLYDAIVRFRDAGLRGPEGSTPQPSVTPQPTGAPQP
jgi:N-acetylmuramoyl-L-alanine amidase